MADEDTQRETDAAREIAGHKAQLAIEFAAFKTELERQQAELPGILNTPERERLMALLRSLGNRIAYRLTSVNSDIVFVSGAIETIRQGPARRYWNPSCLAWMCTPQKKWSNAWVLTTGELAMVVWDTFIVTGYTFGVGGFGVGGRLSADAAHIETATGLSVDEIYALYQQAISCEVRSPSPSVADAALRKGKA